MNDIEEEMASSLAVTEKKPQRVGGHKGLLFQIFDWNKRLAKKKIFSKKLLPAVRSKQTLKKFGGDDKHTKLRSITDENCGVIPSVKNVVPDKKYETRAPSLVAKLMGLDYMPAKQKTKSRKGYCGKGSDRKEKFVNECKRLEGKELILERVDAKNEWRPQKFQKTGLPERRQVVKLGVGQLQIKTVLSRSRKHQPPKLSSPVKSPRSPGKTASRLIDAATKILEPGLHKSRGRHALTYSYTSSCSSNYESMMDEITDSPLELQNSSSYNIITDSMIQKGHYPCTNCDLTRARFGFDSTPVKQSSKPVSPVSHYVEFCCQGYETSQQSNTLPYHVMEDKRVESQYCSASQLNTLKHSYNPAASRKSNNTLNSQKCNSQNGLQQRTEVQNQIPQMKDRKPVTSELSSIKGGQVSGAARAISGTKSFAPIGQSFNGHARDRELIVDDWKDESDRKYGIRRRDARHPEQKKRSTKIHKNFESVGPSSDLSRQLRTGSKVITEKEARFKPTSPKYGQSESSLSKSEHQRRTGYGVKKANGMDSSTFRSSAQYIAQSHSGIEYCGVQANSSSENTREDGQSIRLPKPISMSGDALSTLLEQKLQELTRQGEDDSGNSDHAPKKTTAMILQELISALTTEQHYHHHSVGQSNREQDPCYNYHCLSSADTSFRFKALNTSPLTSLRHESDDDKRLSPETVLEASFLIDSSLSINQDDLTIPLNKRVSENTSCFNSERNTWEPNANLLESTISQRLQPSGQVENLLLDNVTDILCSISVTETSLVGNKLNHAKGVILDVELMLANAGFTIIPFLFTELETLASIIRMRFSYTWTWNQVEGFTFDSLVEYLDSRYKHYSNCGFSVWSRLPLHIDSGMVILETAEEMRRWTELAGLFTDDLIDWDMSHSVGKWTSFEVEAFETGIELDQCILETLVDELVNDLCKY